MKLVVILGTGTDVGKTYATAALAQAVAYAAPRLPLLALKPIESGVTDPDRTDGARLAALCRHVVPAPAPYQFADAVSPHLAAQRAGVHVQLERVVDYVCHQAAGPGLCLVETAGGAFSPVAPGVTNADLANALGADLWLLVAPDALGVLHDTTTTLLALGLRHRAPDEFLLSEARPRDASTGTNAASLRELGIVPRVHALPRDGAFPPALLERILEEPR
jgi:dethiobiotin synthetase